MSTIKYDKMKLMKNFGTYIRNLGKQVEDEVELTVENFLPKNGNLTYLDCGSYDGYRTMQRANAIGTKKVLGLDVLKDVSKKATKKGVKVIFGDLNEKWPIPSNSVDVITSTETIEHLINVDLFLEEAHRVLKKNGLFILSTDNLAAYHNIFALFRGLQPYTGPFLSRKYPIGHRPNAIFYETLKDMYPHLNVMTTKSLVQLLEYNKFKIKAVTGAGFYPFPIPIARLLVKIDKYHASHCIVVGQKI